MVGIWGLSLRNLARTLGLIASLISPSAALSQEGGLITLTLNGDQLELPLSAGHSDWIGSRGFAEVSIMTRPTDVQSWQHFQSLRLAFDLLRTGAQSPEMSILRRSDDAGFQRWYSRSDNGALSVAITGRDLDGKQLQITGTFSGTLGISEDFGRTIDLSDPMPVTGTFDVTLHPIQ